MGDIEGDEIDIDFRILNHQSMEIGWCLSRSKVGVNHTAVAIKFNNIASVVTGFGYIQSVMATCSGSIKIGYGTLSDQYKEGEDKTEKAIGSQAFQGVFHTGVFNPKKYEYKGTFLKVPIATEKEKARASLIMQSMQAIKMGDYKLMENNCRAFVIRVAKMLMDEPEFKSEDWANFENAMQVLISLDYQKLKDAARSAKDAAKRVFTAMFLGNCFEEAVDVMKKDC